MSAEVESRLSVVAPSVEPPAYVRLLTNTTKVSYPRPHCYDCTGGVLVGYAGVSVGVTTAHE